MKRKYLVMASYMTRMGNPASCRRVVMARDHGEALSQVTVRVHQFKKYMGKLDMNCVELPLEA
jgi:hypothetical protein